MLYQFLDQYDSGTPKYDGFRAYKHASHPPLKEEVPEGFRALYVFGNPMNAILSVFPQRISEVA
jgi:hypothetical protein